MTANKNIHLSSSVSH